VKARPLPGIAIRQHQFSTGFQFSDFFQILELGLGFTGVCIDLAK